VTDRVLVLVIVVGSITVLCTVTFETEVTVWVTVLTAFALAKSMLISRRESILNSIVTAQQWMLMIEVDWEYKS